MVVKIKINITILMPLYYNIQTNTSEITWETFYRTS